MADFSWRAASPHEVGARSDHRPFDTTAATHQQSPGGIAHETGELHRLLVESVDEYAIFALDPEGYILSWNAGAHRFKGYTAEEIIGKHFSIFYPPEKIEQGFPQYELRKRRALDASRTRAGASARTARASGRTSSSPRCE